MRAVTTMRVVMTVLAFLLGIAFLARGDYLIGALAIAFGITRVVMLALMTQRRQDLRAAVRERRDQDR